MKKSYIIPAIEISLAEVEQIIAASVKHIDGDSGLGIGEGDTPDVADVNAAYGDDWDDEDW